MRESKLFDRTKLNIKPLKERIHDIDIGIIKNLENVNLYNEKVKRVAIDIVEAKRTRKEIFLMMGGHVVRSGIQKYIIDLMERGYISCIATNGSGVIHDFEFALIGATTESVARYIKDGQFGLWCETGQINDTINSAYREGGLGMGEAIGKAIYEGNFPYKNVSILAACHRLNIPATIHIGIGCDIIHELPNFDGAAAGATSYIDFLKFTEKILNLDGGVIMNFGSAVMAPEVFLKALSMARNVAHQNGNTIQHFTTLVCDLYDIPDDFRKEPSKDIVGYYFRPWKTMLVRTVAEGGKSFYIKGKHVDTLPALWTAINEIEAGYELSMKAIDIEELAKKVYTLKSEGKTIVHCHGCFDLMHIGHIKYFQAAKKRGDVLLVTVTPDIYVDKGPGRPVFNQDLRADSIAALECVDYVAINKWPTAEETLRLIKPDIYVKGQEFEYLEDKTGKIQKEYEIAKEIGIKVQYTHEIVFSSTELLRKYFK